MNRFILLILSLFLICIFNIACHHKEEIDKTTTEIKLIKMVITSFSEDIDNFVPNTLQLMKDNSGYKDTINDSIILKNILIEYNKINCKSEKTDIISIDIFIMAQLYFSNNSIDTLLVQSVTKSFYKNNFKCISSKAFLELLKPYTINSNKNGA